MDCNDQQHLVRNRLTAISPDVLARIGRQRTTLLTAFEQFAKAARAPAERAKLKDFRDALMGHVALVDAVFEAIGDDQTQDNDDRDSDAENAR